MRTLLLQGLLYGVAVAAIAGVARAVRRPFPAPALGLAALLPVVFLLPGFVTNRTLLPVADINIFAPWSGTVPEERHTVWLNDAVTQLAPWRESVKDAFENGSLPLRNRWTGCGQPLAANSQSTAWAPWRLLGLPLDAGAAFNLEAAIKLLLGLTGAWLWLREMGGSPAGAGVGALLFGFSLPMTAWLLFPLGNIVALWPWAFFAMELARDTALRRRATVLLVGVFALWPLAGQPQLAALGAGFALVWLASRWLLGDLPDWRPLAGRVALAAGFALALTAFSLLPEIFAILASNRLGVMPEPHFARELSLAPHDPIWPSAPFSLLFPRVFGDAAGHVGAHEAAGNYYEMGGGWIGAAGWAAVALLWRPGSPRSRAALAALLPAALGLALAAGAWPFTEISSIVPAFANVFPLRFLSWIMPAGALIAALELTRLERDAGRRRAAIFPVIAAAAVAGLLVATFLRFRHLWKTPDELALRRHAILVAFVVLVGFAWAASGLARGRRSAIWLLLPISAVELFWLGRDPYNFLPSSWVFPETPAVAFLRSRPAPFRVVGSGAALFPNTAAFARVEEIRTHDPVERRDYVTFLDGTAGYPPGEYFKMIRDLDAPVLDFLNVRFLIAPSGSAAPSVRWRPVYAGRDAAIFENASALPRIFAPQRISWVASVSGEGAVGNALHRFGAAATEILANRDFRARAWVAGPVAPPEPRPLAAVDYVESVNRASFRISPERRSGDGLVIASLVQDGGWSARDQMGRRLQTWLANGPFLAIRVPADASAIRLDYSPPGFRAGVAVTLTTLGLLAALGIRGRARREAVHPQEP